MKRFFTALTLVLALAGCNNIAEVESRVEKLEERVSLLEQQMKDLNSQVDVIQKLLSGKYFVQSAEALPDNSGYKLVLVDANGKTTEKTVLNGKDGTDGKNGADGQTPVIGIRKDTDGYYYWTVGGEWLLSGGQKVRANGVDGEDGQDGKDGQNGLTPEIKVENGKWYYKLGNGAWTYCGEAATMGPAGPIQQVDLTSKPGYVIFTLSDNSQLEIPISSAQKLQIILEEGAFSDMEAGSSASASYEVLVPAGISYTLESYEPAGWEVVITPGDDNKGMITLTLPDQCSEGKMLLVATGSDASQYVKVVVINPIQPVLVTEIVDSGAGILQLPEGATNIVSAASWITVQGLQIILAANTTYDSRMGVVTYLDAQGQHCTLQITQAQKDAILITSNTVNAVAAGETLQFVLQANVTVEASTSASWLTVAPVTKGLEEKLFSIEVSANPETQERSATIDFVSGDLKQTLTVMQAAASEQPQPVAGDAYVLVTDASSLSAGDELLLVSPDGLYAMAGQYSSGQSNYRNATSVTVEDGIIEEINDNVAVVTLEGAAGAWKLKVSDGYLAAISGNKNYLATTTSVSNYASWTIAIASNGTATVKALAGDRNHLRYNENNGTPRFSCYGSTTSVSTELCLYRKESLVFTPVTEYQALGAYLGNKQWTYTPGTDQYCRSYAGDALTFVLLDPETNAQLEVSGYTAGSSVGSDLTLQVDWRKGTQFILSKSFSMQVLQDQDGKVWIGDARGNGFILKK